MTITTENTSADRWREFSDWLASLGPADYIREVLLDNARDTILDRLMDLGDEAPSTAMRVEVGDDCGTVRFSLTLEIVPTGRTMAEWEAEVDASDPHREGPA